MQSAALAFYNSSMIVLLGAGFTRVWSRRHRPAGVVPEPGAGRDEDEADPRGASSVTTATVILLMLLVPLAAHAAEREVTDLDVEIDVAGEGLFSALKRNVETTLSIGRAKAKELDAARLRQLHARAPEEVERALEPFGYYRPVVRSELDHDGTSWTARYEIDPGPQMEVSDVAIEVRGPGADDPGFRRAAREFPLQEGQALSHPAYDAGKQAFLDHAAAAGYLDAVFEVAELRVDLDRYAAEAALSFETGPRYLFGDVEFHQRVLEPELLLGYVTFDAGEPLDLDELSRFQGALSDSPYFQRVEVLPRPERAEDLRVPIDVELLPAARQRWDLGAGYGTDTGPRGTAKLELRRINRRGHRAEGELLGSEIERSIATRYLIPGAYPRTDVLTFSLGYSEERPDTSSSETALAGVGLTRSRGRWREAFGLTFQRSDFEVGVDAGISELLIPDASWSRVRADDRIYATHGERVELSVRGAEQALASDSSFVQVTAEAKAVRSLGPWLRAIGRVGVGRTWTSDFRRLPPRIRFFAGGDRSVRGYAYQELGLRDEEDNVIGGEALLTAGIELDSLFLDLGRAGRWGAAVFYDAGGAAGEIGDQIESGTGAGLRWLSPIGLVRADAAWAVSQPDTPVRFHLMIGPDL
jgi:translocation and assembly module TamA